MSRSAIPTGVVDEPLSDITGLTLCTLLERTARAFASEPAYSDSLGPFRQARSVSWHDFRETALDVAAGLIARGVPAGARVAIMASNRIEHILADAAVMHANAIPVPIYLTSSADQVLSLAKASVPTAVFVESTDHLRRWAPALDLCDQIELIVLLDPQVSSADSRAVGWKELVDSGAYYRAEQREQCESRWRAVDPDMTATLVFTSGTTGAPKGVVLTHRNVSYEAGAVLAANQLAGAGTTVSYLPYAHIAERVLSMYLPYAAGGHVRLIADLAELADALREVRPTRFFAVPRIWEKIQAAATQTVATGQRRAPRLASALQVGQRYVQSLQTGRELSDELREEFSNADERVLAKIRAELGFDRLVWAATAAAPMPAETLLFFAGLGIPIYDAYGMTETTGAVVANTPSAFRLGSIGQPLPGMQAKLAEDGEILLQGPTVSPGYYGETPVVPTDDPDWLHTGDLGRIDTDGFLYIVGRKKEMIITSSGKNISPSSLEELLEESDIVARAMVYGDRRPYLVALITLDPDALRAVAECAGAEVGQLAGEDWVTSLVQDAVDRANTRVSRPEQVKTFAVLDEQWTVDGGQMTPTLKLRRAVVAARHAELLDELYRPRAALGPTEG